MITLQGQYQISPVKRLTILAEPQHFPTGVFLTDLQAIQQACAHNEGQCNIQVSTTHGIMQGTLTERPGRKFHHRLSEGHVAFLPQA